MAAKYRICKKEVLSIFFFNMCVKLKQKKLVLPIKQITFERMLLNHHKYAEFKKQPESAIKIYRQYLDYRKLILRH